MDRQGKPSCKGKYRADALMDHVFVFPVAAQSRLPVMWL